VEFKQNPAIQKPAGDFIIPKSIWTYFNSKLTIWSKIGVKTIKYILSPSPTGAICPESIWPAPLSDQPCADTNLIYKL